MQHGSVSPVNDEASSDSSTPPAEREGQEVVSTHVLVPVEQVQKLRELARRTRIHQSEYLREAVDDLLVKYHKAPPPEGGQQ